MPSPLVTVSLTYYRCREFVREAVESILGQTMRELVLVVINDADPDPPWDLLADIDDPRLVRFDLPTNRGTYFANDVVLRASATPFFAVQDADDVSAPTRLARLIEALEADTAIAAASLLGGPRGRRVRSTPRSRMLGRPFVHRYCHIGLQRTEILRELGGYYGGYRIAWDTLLMNLLALAGELLRAPGDPREPLAFVSEPLCWIRARPGSLTTAPQTHLRGELRRAHYEIYERKWRRAFAARGSADLPALIRELLTSDVPAELAAESRAQAELLRRKIASQLDEIPARDQSLVLESARL